MFRRSWDTERKKTPSETNLLLFPDDESSEGHWQNRGAVNGRPETTAAASLCECHLCWRPWWNFVSLSKQIRFLVVLGNPRNPRLYSFSSFPLSLGWGKKWDRDSKLWDELRLLLRSCQSKPGTSCIFLVFVGKAFLTESLIKKLQGIPWWSSGWDLAFSLLGPGSLNPWSGS